MSPIPTIVSEGLVFTDGTLLLCEKDGQAEPVDFSPFEGQEVYVLIAHLPDLGANGIPTWKRDTWGFGSCALQISGVCPYGHHLEPWKSLLVMFGRGVLLRKGDWWEVPGLDFPPREFLVGHRCKFFAMPTTLQVHGDLSPTEISKRLEELTSTLSKLKNSRR